MWSRKHDVFIEERKRRGLLPAGAGRLLGDRQSDGGGPFKARDAQARLLRAMVRLMRLGVATGSPFEVVDPESFVAQRVKGISGRKQEAVKSASKAKMRRYRAPAMNSGGN